MAVYTDIPDADLASFLAAYDLGSLEKIEGICAGTENSNYFLDTSAGRFVLTLFERLPVSEIPYYLHVTEWLSQHGIPCPAPVHARHGEILGQLCGKPAAIVQRLSGQSIEDRAASEGEITALGQLLARMHLAGRDFPEEHPNPAGLNWCQETGRRLIPKLSPAERELLVDEREAQKQWLRDKLPGGVIHADLFPDNVLFQGVEITGTIDYYYAIALTAWAGLLSPGECQELIGIGRQLLQPAMVTDERTGAEVSHHQRISEMAWPRREDFPLLGKIADGIARLTGVPVACQEPLQILHAATDNRKHA